MRRSRVFVEADEAEGHLALLSLRRGVSAWSTWAFDAMDAGLTITVGPGSNCDWQIASPGIAPLYIAFTGESLVARAIKHDPRVRLNGAMLSESWVVLCHGDWLELGPSSLMITLSHVLQNKDEMRTLAKKRRQQCKAKAKNKNGAKRPELEDERRREREFARAAALVLHNDPSRHGPALFRDPELHEGPSQARLMWYAAIAFGTYLAYAGWLMLLDEL
jgi:hypothetical protein